MQISKTKSVGFIAGLLVAVLVWNSGLDLPAEGKKCLALSLMAVVWWAVKAMDPGITSLTLLVSYVLLLDSEVVPSTAIFQLWTTPTMYLVIGGFLISDAIRRSGLGERLACHFIRRLVRSYSHVIISCYVLGFLLSFMIPHPWPRSFLLVSVMAYVIHSSKLSGKYAANVGLAIFAGSIPTAMILITGDSTLNPLVADFAGTTMSWGQWFVRMGIPGILAAALTCTVQLVLFGKPAEFQMDQTMITEKLKEMGGIKRKELMSVIVMVLAIAMWMTDSLHGIHAGWIAVGAVILLASPLVGVVNRESWNAVNISTLLFLCAALSIGSIGRLTGMNEWIAEALMPPSLSPNPYLFALVACGICMLMHMLLGSTLAVLGIAAPAIISFGAVVGIPPVVSAMLAYTAVCLHWLLPFHHMNLLVGLGENGGGYSDKDVLKLGLVQTVIVVVVCMVEVLWWGILGIL